MRKFLCADYLFVLLKACRVRMSTHTKTGPQLLAWLDDKGLQLPSGEEAAVGDVVVCSVRGNFLDPCDLGTVYMKNTNGEQFVLPDGHKDGSLCDMFVLTYTKSRVNKRKIKCKFDLFVFVCISLHMFISFLFVALAFLTTILSSMLIALTGWWLNKEVRVLPPVGTIIAGWEVSNVAYSGSSKVCNKDDLWSNYKLTFVKKASAGDN